VSELLVLMKRFREALFDANREELLAITSDDFEWCQHFARNAEELPNGRTLGNVDAMLKELAWRAEHWRKVRYSELVERVAGDDLLVQTFRISGLEDGKEFLAKAVDLYPVRDGLIARKDTYWKHLKL
jgi:ketosteroid isomerase-like protein